MSDRELLELAAKAAGIDAHVTEWSSTVEDDEGDYLKPWNPLTDDGDALRLAVTIGERFGATLTITRSGIVLYYGNSRLYEYRDNDDAKPFDFNAATRRAIVRAAAEIGRNMT